MFASIIGGVLVVIVVITAQLRFGSMFASIIGGMLGLFFLLFAGLFALAAFVFWIWMLIHAVTNKGLGDGEKIAWVLVILFTHFIGALIYFLVAKRRGAAAV